MSLPAHSRLGPYEIVAAIGAGGMGEVYRATDTKLGRDVAIKVLPAEVAGDTERLARFEREAKLLASLNHSNIAHVYGFETATLPDGSTAYFLAMELVPGEDVAERLKRGPIPVEDGVAIAKQIAEALEEAHEHGIVHRDLKPANIKLTPDGKVKVLDFGLAKAYAGEVASSSSADLSQSPTLAHTGTQVGLILGTAAYMSPEQARGKPVDKRADIWAFGVVLFEMLTGRKLFEGETVSDTLAAVLRQDLDWTRLPPATPASLRALLQRCLERDPRQRLHDIADARLELEQSAAATVDSPPPRRSRARRSITLLIVGGLALALGYLAGWRTGAAREAPAASFQRMTFRRGYFTNARFAPDGQTVLYAAAWEGQPLEIFQARPGGGELPLGIKGADVLSVSRSGEMAVLLPRLSGQNQYLRMGTLARVPASGGTPRELAEGVLFADWAPDGQALAVIREVAGAARLEFPLGQVLYEPKGRIVNPRVSPRGDRVALFERESQWSWSLASVDRGGRRQTLSAGWSNWWDLAWSPSGDEVWFSALKGGLAASIHAVDLHGRRRALVQGPGTVTIHDVSADGRALVSRISAALVVMGRPRGAPGDRRLSRLEGSSLADLSADGTLLLMRDDSEALAGHVSLSLRNMDGTPAVQLGEGEALSLSADGKWALGLRPPDDRLVVYPTGSGEPRVLAADLEGILAARFLADGRGVLVAARTDATGMGLFLASPDGGPARPVVQRGRLALGEGSLAAFALPVSPDGRLVAPIDAARQTLLVSLDGGEVRPVPSVEANERPAQWTPDGRQLYVYRLGEIPARVFKVDVVTGARELWREIAPPDTAGVSGINSFRVTPDGSAYAYSYEQYLSELYVVEGLR